MDGETRPHSSWKKRFARLSLSNMLLLVTIVCLALAVLVMNGRVVQLQRKLADARRELSTLQPLPLEEVARQFKERTTLGSISVNVKDVRYSPGEDAYKVRFSWTDAKTGQSWSTDVKLAADGYGTYIGVIRNGPFIEPLGYKDKFIVAVETPSSFEH